MKSPNPPARPFPEANPAQSDIPSAILSCPESAAEKAFGERIRPGRAGVS